MFEHPGVVTCQKTHFGPFFDPDPKMWYFKDFGAKWSLKKATNSLKTGAEGLSEHPKWSRVIFEKTRFRPFVDPSSIPKWAGHLKAFWGQTVPQNGPITGQNSPKCVFEHPKWSRVIFGRK